MNKSYARAIGDLEAASPLRAKTPIAEWTKEEEDAVLTRVLECRGAAPEKTTGLETLSSRSAGRTRVGRRRRPFLIALATGAAGAVALGLALTTSPSPQAFAAWTATTTTPSAARLAAATSGCHSVEKKATVLLPNATAGMSSILVAPLRLTDSRGPFEMLVYAGPAGGGVCLWDSGLLSIAGGIGSGPLGVTGGSGTQPDATDRSIGIPMVGFVRHNGSPLTYAYGVTGTQVTAVTLRLTNGHRVQATVQNGFYGAWWPSATDVAGAAVTSAEGPSHQDFGSIGPNLP